MRQRDDAFEDETSGVGVDRSLRGVLESVPDVVVHKTLVFVRGCSSRKAGLVTSLTYRWKTFVNASRVMGFLASISLVCSFLHRSWNGFGVF